MSAASQIPEADTGKGAAETSTCTRKREIGPDAVVERTDSVTNADLLECPLYFESSSLDSPPIYQCQNGHIACSACFEKMHQGNKGCPTCSLPTGSFRCISLEKILASLEVSCKYARYGCGFMSRKSSIQFHECCCKYEPFPCPFPECVYEGSQFTMPLHLAEVHKVPTVEYNNISGTSFSMKPSDRIVMVKVEEIVGTCRRADVYFVHREPVRDFISGDQFFCTSMGHYYHQWFHLKVAYNQDHFDAVNYSMRSPGSRSLRNARDYLKGDFLFLPLCKSGFVLSGAERMSCRLRSI